MAGAKPSAGKAASKTAPKPEKISAPVRKSAVSKLEPADKKTGPKRIPPGSIQLQFAGELILVKSPDRKLAGLFRRYEALFETFANMERAERILNYKFINALMLTSYAKKTTDLTTKKKLFDLKNELFLDIANNIETRRKVAFKYMTSRNFRVIQFCDPCIAKNTESKLDRHLWKFCPKCQVDRNFYNLLSMQHKFPEGSATLFLSNDLVPKVVNLTALHKGRLGDAKEEAIFQRYQYNTKNLDAFSLDAVMKMHAKLLKMN
jgi:hypothetical protein